MHESNDSDHRQRMTDALRHIVILCLTANNAEQKLAIIRDYCEKLIREANRAQEPQ